MKNSIQTYERRHNDRFSEKLIKVTKIVDRWIYFETKYGLCRKKDSDIGKSCYRITSAINKTEFLRNRLFDLYGETFDLSLVEYKNTKSRITLICKKHGKFNVNTGSAMFGSADCLKCSIEKSALKRKFTEEQFIKKANKIHSNFYDYSKVIYEGDGSNNSIIIKCPAHGDFKQKSGSHLQGRGCQKCARNRIKLKNSENPHGWTLTSWMESSKVSRNFDSFKVYIIKCWNDEEEFYKIGRTFKKITSRFKSKSEMPYEYEIIKIYIDSAENIFNLESKLKKMNKTNKYLPKLEFCGMQECFNKINTKL